MLWPKRGANAVARYSALEHLSWAIPACPRLGHFPQQVCDRAPHGYGPRQGRSDCRRGGRACGKGDGGGPSFGEESDQMWRDLYNCRGGGAPPGGSCRSGLKDGCPIAGGDGARAGTRAGIRRLSGGHERRTGSPGGRAPCLSLPIGPTTAAFPTIVFSNGSPVMGRSQQPRMTIADRAEAVLPSD